MGHISDVSEKMLKEKGFIEFRKVLTLKGPRTVIFLTDRGYKKVCIKKN